jgi:hypothetical protein
MVSSKYKTTITVRFPNPENLLRDKSYLPGDESYLSKNESYFLRDEKRSIEK